MSGLAKFIEDEGLATTLIALVRDQAEAVAPPRALWVPFPLGRPFGVPGDAAFQTRVLRAVLELLDRPCGPVLEDFPDDAPRAESDGEGWVCPVRFPKAADRGGSALLDRVLAEIGRLAPWYAVGLDRRGRTTMGASGLEPDRAAGLLAGWSEGEVRGSPVEGLAPFDALRLASEDLKAFYLEAAAARPGPDPGEAVTAWFWTQTAAAELIRALRTACLDDDDPAIRDLGDSMLVPEAYRD